eukprot:jgi/Botrbrau1/1660/Bobra.116_2s0004.1
MLSYVKMGGDSYSSHGFSLFELALDAVQIAQSIDSHQNVLTSVHKSLDLCQHLFQPEQNGTERSCTKDISCADWDSFLSTIQCGANWHPAAPIKGPQPSSSGQHRSSDRKNWLPKDLPPLPGRIDPCTNSATASLHPQQTRTWSNPSTGSALHKQGPTNAGDQTFAASRRFGTAETALGSTAGGTAAQEPKVWYPREGTIRHSAGTGRHLPCNVDSLPNEANALRGPSTSTPKGVPQGTADTRTQLVDLQQAGSAGILTTRNAPNHGGTLHRNDLTTSSSKTVLDSVPTVPDTSSLLIPQRTAAGLPANAAQPPSTTGTLPRSCQFRLAEAEEGQGMGPRPTEPQTLQAQPPGPPQGRGREGERRGFIGVGESRPHAPADGQMVAGDVWGSESRGLLPDHGRTDTLPTSGLLAANKRERDFDQEVRACWEKRPRQSGAPPAEVLNPPAASTAGSNSGLQSSSFRGSGGRQAGVAGGEVRARAAARCPQGWGAGDRRGAAAYHRSSRAGRGASHREPLL